MFVRSQYAGNVITLRHPNAIVTTAMAFSMTRPCNDICCRGDASAAEQVALAASICRDRGTKLTAIRQQILELLWESGRPTGAYELIEALKQRNLRRVGPPTVYRALEFLMTQGLVSKVESRNAYVPCAHPDHTHDCVFLICADCGASAELEDPRIEKLLAEDAASMGFHIVRQVVEVQGTCRSCRESAAV